MDAHEISGLGKAPDFAKDKDRVAVAVVPEAMREAMGTSARLLKVSGETMSKQISAHPEVRAGDYAMVQRIVDGENYRQKVTHRIGFAQDDNGQWWTASWKRTRDGNELFLNNLHRMRGHRVQRKRQQTAAERRANEEGDE